MGKKRLLAVTVCAVVIGGGSATVAFAGEVKGPPGSAATAQPGGNPNRTGAPANSNSICSYSGLNDFDSNEGQNTSHVQTPGHDAPFPGTTGHGTCRGGTNPERQK
jgi:hypothetical protein